MPRAHAYSCFDIVGYAFLALLALSCSPATADDAVVPRPDPPFKGIANRTLTGSKPDFPQGVAAPKDAPNVLLVLVDDAGFGNPSTFGGPCQTPTLTRLAEQGLRYNRFHVTALCSPTRAALLSGLPHCRLPLRPVTHPHRRPSAAAW